MDASTHPWRSAAASLFGAAGLALAIGLGTAMETSAPALDLASDAVAMPSATPPTAEPATTELDVPAADGVRVQASSSPDPTVSASPSTPSPSPAVSASPAEVAPGLAPDAVPQVAPEVAPEAVPEVLPEAVPDVAPEAAESVAAPTPTRSSSQPMIGPPMPTNGDTDCADYERRSFPIDPANDPNNLDADGDGIACEPPPGE